jgi:hypothetical protein
MKLNLTEEAAEKLLRMMLEGATVTLIATDGDPMSEPASIITADRSSEWLLVTRSAMISSFRLELRSGETLELPLSDSGEELVDDEEEQRRQAREAIEVVRDSRRPS